MKATLQTIANSIDDSIRHGQGGSARSELRRVARGKIDREHVVRFATLARRAHLPEIGVRLLNPIVRAERKQPISPSDDEIIEYANCLTKIGAPEEALALLESLESSGSARRWFAVASAHMHLWDYQAAKPWLTRYVASSQLTTYEQLVGKVNLAAVLTYEREHRKASYLLRELVYETGVRQLWLLRGNCLELAAVNCFTQGRFEQAEGFLQEAERLLAKSESVDALWLRKWRALLALYRRKPSVPVTRELREVRRLAEGARNWETLRDLDRFEALKKRDQQLLAHLWHGTPFPSFRRRLAEDYGRAFAWESEYKWRLGPPGKAATTLDLTSGRDSRSGSELKVGQSLHRLLSTLASDFYRPFRIAPLFSSLFPGEHYNPATSGSRVHQAIKLLRAWLEKAEVPIRIECDSGDYRLASHVPCLIRIGEAPVGMSKRDLLLQRLRKEWPSAEFSVKQAAAFLDVSPRTALRLLDEALHQGAIERQGKTSGSRYRFPVSKS